VEGGGDDISASIEGDEHEEELVGRRRPRRDEDGMRSGDGAPKVSSFRYFECRGIHDD
jgi:hypothetical protein